MITSDLAQDRPIGRARDDRLSRSPFVENIIRALVIEERDPTGKVVARHSTGVVVGLTGKWGSGKSSILGLIAEQLEKTDYIVVATFNPWLFKGRDELLAAFFNELREALGRSKTEQVKALLAQLDRYRVAIDFAGNATAFAADAAGASGAATVVRKVLGRFLKAIVRPKDLSPQKERLALEDKLRKANVAVVVLIDELDRVEDEDVRAVAQLVKAAGDIRGISYLVAYDPHRVADALGRGEGPSRQESGEAYLEKIIQHPIPLRPLFTEDVDALLEALLAHHDLKLPNELSESEQQVLDYIRNVAETPRDLKRLAGAYAVLTPMLRGEVSPADLLGYCWILTKAPALRDALARNLDVMVDDTADKGEIMRRVVEEHARKKPDLVSALGESAAAHLPLLELLFPRFAENPGATTEPNRIARRRNLVRTLYLGDPPGVANRETVERLWACADEDELEQELRRHLTSGGLRAVIDRLDDLLPNLPAERDAPFFRALARALIRDHDWYLDPEPNGVLADDAATHLLRLGLRDRKHVERAREAVLALVNKGDLILAPYILRKHLFRWGLTHHDKAERPGEYLFDKEETMGLLETVEPAYRAAVLDGTILRRITNCEALFTLSNAQRWDDELHVSLSEQIDLAEARASLAALLVPPGHSIDRPSIDAMLDGDRLLDAMDEAGEGFEATSWTEGCFLRLRAALSGRNNFWLTED